jgi:hypothetical protein
MEGCESWADATLSDFHHGVELLQNWPSPENLAGVDEVQEDAGWQESGTSDEILDHEIISGRHDSEEARNTVENAEGCFWMVKVELNLSNVGRRDAVRVTDLVIVRSESYLLLHEYRVCTFT